MIDYCYHIDLHGRIDLVGMVQEGGTAEILVWAGGYDSDGSTVIVSSSGLVLVVRSCGEVGIPFRRRFRGLAAS